jgi:hypothetical protein
MWAMSANGAARLLFEYPEPTRSQVLDLLFKPGTGTVLVFVTDFTILKDMDVQTTRYS